MDCREAQSMIVPFIEDKLSIEQKEAFLEHIEHCSSCYDELEVYFIVYSGLKQLDADTPDISDFKGELKRYIEVQKADIAHAHSKKVKFRMIVALSAVILVIVGIGIYRLNRSDNAILQQTINTVKSTFTNTKAEPVKKSVEQAMVSESWKQAGFYEIVRNTEIPETEPEGGERDNEEDRTD